MWAETNPDSIKAIWLESKHKPEDIELDWDNLYVRAIVVAPGFSLQFYEWQIKLVIL